MKINKRIWCIFFLLPVFITLLTFCAYKTDRLESEYEDGTYRGVFIDQENIQLNVQFTLEGGVVTDAQFRHLKRDDNYFLGTEEEPYKSVVSQYQEALDYLVGKNLNEHLSDLYQPQNFITSEVDGYTAATLRTPKIISAIRDGLNRGVYSY